MQENVPFWSRFEKLFNMGRGEKCTISQHFILFTKFSNMRKGENQGPDLKNNAPLYFRFHQIY